MLHSLNALISASIIATDGEMGKVYNFLFDDQSWTVRYVVVDVGNWLDRRYVLLSTSAIEHPDWTNKIFHVHLTKDQVRHSPVVDAHKPVTRQQEIAIHEYFGWAAYWADWYLPSSLISSQRKYPLHSKEDPHLRSALDVAGYRVWATDGKIGQLKDFIIEISTWHLNYIIVSTGEWLFEYPLVVSTRWVKSVSWDAHCVNLDHERKDV